MDTPDTATSRGPAADGLFARPRRVVAPGAVHVPDWLDLTEQRRLVEACRGWATEGPGIRSAALPTGPRMSVKTVCLGWHWYPYRYSRTRDDQDGSPVTPFPDRLVALGRRAVADAYADPARAATYTPDIALINHYGPDARMGMHRDSDERSLDPVVSLSLGVACVFRLGNTTDRGRPWVDIPLHSGDLVVRRRQPARLPRRPDAAARPRRPRHRAVPRPAQHHPARVGAGGRARCNRMTPTGVLPVDPRS